MVAVVAGHRNVLAGTPILAMVAQMWLERATPTLYIGLHFWQERWFGRRTGACWPRMLSVHKCMVTAVSGFIEQVSSVIKGILKYNYHPSTPSQFLQASKS